MFQLEPLEDRLILQKVEAETTSSGSHGTKIALPDTAREKPNRAIVIAVGPGVRTKEGEFIPLPVKVGQKVMFSKYSGTEVKVDGKDYLITPIANILCIDHEGEKPLGEWILGDALTVDEFFQGLNDIGELQERGSLAEPSEPVLVSTAADLNIDNCEPVIIAQEVVDARST